MPRPPAPCGSYTAYKRHLRKGEPVDDACRRASDERVAEQAAARRWDNPPEPEPTPVDEFEGWEGFDSERRDKPETPPAHRSRAERLQWGLSLVEAAMAHVAGDEPAKLAPLSKRHSELLAEIESLEGPAVAKEVDPFDEFFNGDLSNVARFPTSSDREAS